MCSLGKSYRKPTLPTFLEQSCIPQINVYIENSQVHKIKLLQRFCIRDGEGDIKNKTCDPR